MDRLSAEGRLSKGKGRLCEEKGCFFERTDRFSEEDDFFQEVSQVGGFSKEGRFVGDLGGSWEGGVGRDRNEFVLGYICGL
jgi:hypothetical protein